ncbi:MAG: nucleotidyl transferase AbiEii/AbiGii toxin family protein, partial [Pseudonocardia sp.]|nr:nucleotidyl transferase AbiEii/AbiGii toxin family protein [Pseudonocardia sp.]
GRLHPRVTLDVGAVLHPEDLAADKVLALWARARPRDYHDVAALIERFGHDRLLELAAEKDAGFTTETFVDALTAIRRLTDSDWTEDGIDPRSVAALTQLFEQWNTELRHALP